MEPGGSVPRGVGVKRHPRLPESRKVRYPQTVLPLGDPGGGDIGVLGQDFTHLIQDLGRRITENTGEPRETCWLC
ncbi:hypothetical protein Pcinc_037582 [Petrolisthes cinctipes]|uniref:Uncharacterized protein n=1 Tax=Petrolisthes cinctipes TaxID=88211 RepID=A0AAE1BS40_PETCI|nr:hypothetical protein Pcinc_037582 [Petrolisthes cinctipes]